MTIRLPVRIPGQTGLTEVHVGKAPKPTIADLPIAYHVLVCVDGLNTEYTFCCSLHRVTFTLLHCL